MENKKLPNESEEAFQIRQKIHELSVQYFEIEHLSKMQKPFVPEQDRVTYAGRVFDQQEIGNLMDASLEFWLTAGRFCDDFEKQFSQYLGVKHTLLVNSGSSANLVAFSALTSSLLKDKRLRKGDEVITVAAGFPTTINPMLLWGATPVFVDVTVDDGTYNIDVNLLEAARTEKTKAVMLAHTLGNPFRLKEILSFCQKYDLYLIEDNCDALGSLYEGKPTGTFGHLATSSFYPPHHMTMGEGGAVYTNHATLKRAAESFRDWGRDCWCPSGQDNTCKKRFGWTLGDLPEGYDHKYIYSHVGFNLKATEMQAAIGVAQLQKLPGFVQARKSNFAFLRESFQELEDVFVLPNATPSSEPSWFGFPLTLRDGVPFQRQELIQFLEKQKIQTRLLFAGNYLRHPAFTDWKNQGNAFRVVGELTQSDRIARNTFWLGLYPGMKPGMLEYTHTQVRRFLQQFKS